MQRAGTNGRADLHGRLPAAIGRGLPGQAIFIATNLPVAQAMGLPIAPLPVLMAVDAIPDVLATVGNVTADMTATTVVNARSDDGKETGSGPAAA